MPSPRSIVILGITTAFIACAFVPPSEANFKALAERAKIAVENRTRAVIAGSNIPAVKDAKKAAALLKTLSKDPRMTVLVEEASKGSSLKSVTSLSTAAELLGSLVPKPETVAKTVVKKVAQASAEFPSQAWKTFVSSVKDPELEKQISRVDWAILKGDASLCGQVEGVMGSATRGDLLALCLGLITREPLRCSQIGTDASALKSICETELSDKSDESFSGLQFL
jgi:hypothetical protein